MGKFIAILICSVLALFINISLIAQSDYEYVSSYDEADKRMLGIRNATGTYLFDENFQSVCSNLKKKILINHGDRFTDTVDIFATSEELLLSYWCNNYTFILNNYPFFESTANYNFNGDSLYHQISMFSLKNLEQGLKNIDNFNQNNIEAAFLKLFLKYLVANTSLNDISKDEVQNEAKAFTSKYENSKFTGFIQNNMLLTYQRSGFGVGFCLTAGFMATTSYLNDYFGNNIPVGGEFNFAYKRFRLDVNFTGSLGSSIKESFNNNGAWDVNSRYTQATGSGNIGFELASNDKHALYPFAGLTTTAISSYVRTEAGGEENVKITSFPGYQFGVAYEKRFLHKKSFSNYKERFIASNSDTYWCLKLKSGILLPGFTDENSKLSGEMIFIKLAVGILTNPAIAR